MNIIEIESTTSKLHFDSREAVTAAYNALKYEVPGARFTPRFKDGTWDGFISMFSRVNSRFPTDVVFLVVDALKAKGLNVTFDDKRDLSRTLPPVDDAAIANVCDGVILRDYQVAAVQAILKHKTGIIQSPTGCHSKGTLVMRYDGWFVPVERVKVGDQLMGPDSTPRTVKELYRGHDQLYRITPLRGGRPFVVNLDHILTLQRTRCRKYVSKPGSQYEKIQKNDEIIDVSLREWMGWSKTRKHLYKLFRRPVKEFGGERTEFKISPYLLGVLLGDGCLKYRPTIANPDSEIVEMLESEAERWGLILNQINAANRCPAYALVQDNWRTGKRTPNPLTEALRHYNLFGKLSDEKFIPQEYKVASWDDRMQLLAGLLDTDGSLQTSRTKTGKIVNGYDYISKSWRLSEGVAFVARSLGFTASFRACVKRCQGGHKGQYYRLHISGDVHQIPCRVKRKQAPEPEHERIFNNLRTGFKVEPVGAGEFFGFRLDGDQRYLLEDFTVTHNSGKTIISAGFVKYAIEKGLRVLFLTNKKELLYQTQKAYQKAGMHPTLIGDGTKDFSQLAIGMVQTLFLGLPVKRPGKFVMVKGKKTWQKPVQRPGKPEVLAYLNNVDVIVLDEAHGGSSESVQAICNKCVNSIYRIGLTATPLMKGWMDDLRLMAITGDIIKRITLQDLIDRRLLAQPYIKHIKINNPMLPQYMPYARAYKAGVVQNSWRNQVVVNEAAQLAARGMTVLVLVTQINHGNRLMDEFEEYPGLKAQFIHGSKDKGARDRAVERLQNKEIDVLVSSTITDEGVDIPAVSAVILAGGGKSSIKQYQRIGRGMRPKPGDNSVYIVDFIDLTNKHLARHSLERFKTIRDEPAFIRVDDFIFWIEATQKCTYFQAYASGLQMLT